MKSLSIFIQVLIVAILFNSSSASGDENEKKTIRVLCYNIHYGQGMDGVYDIKRLADVINAHKPDLVALQEVDVGVERSGRIHEARMLGEMTGMAVRYGPTQHYQGGLYGNAVLSKLPISDVHIQPLPYTEATPEKTTYPRGCIVVTVEGPGGKPLRFISTHFQHNVHEDRVAEAKAINRFFTDEDADPKNKIPTILAGDMNAKPEEEPVQILQKKWTNAIEAEPEPTAPSKDPRSRIDYIFYRPASAFMLKETKVIAEEMASDHRPVFAIFEIAD